MKKTFAFLLGISTFSCAFADSVTPIGTATFKNGVQIPAYAVNYQNPMEDGMTTSEGSCRQNACSFQFTVPAEQAPSLKLLKLDGISWVLAPKDAIISRAAVGANGSAVLVLKSTKANLSAYDSSACVGCALSAAAPYFDNAKRELEETFPGVDGDRPKKGLKSVRKDRTTAFYSYPANGRTTHGVAKLLDGKNPYDDVNFNKLEVTVDQKNKKLATTILNFYYFQNKQ